MHFLNGELLIIFFFSIVGYRIEDVMLQYFNLKDEERESDHDSEGIVHDKEYVISTLMRLKSEDAAAQSSEVLSAQSQEYKQEIMNLQHQLEIAKEQLRLLEPDPQKFTSLGEIESSEERLSEALNLVEKRKRHLLTDHSSSYQETVEQINSVVQYIINAQVEGNRSLENSEFSSWLDQHGHKTDANGSNCVSVGPDEASFILIRNQSSPQVQNSMCHTSQNEEGYHFSSLNHDCPPQWHGSVEIFQPPLSQETSVSLNGISSTSAISMTPPSQHSKFASTCQPLRSEEAANYETME
ncbi:agamous-like MADS-box protein AGL104 [Coffea arabica]|uniref:Agamous-like MADS-box protein AGL104 n=1 Tax=Coffea arabica TaxID=13443 RepID=A0ABM4VAE6_COFAR